jgi:hypothetical protein
LEVHAVKHKTRHTPQQNRQPKQKPKSSYHAHSQSTSTCKYCGRKDEYNKANAPLFGRSVGNVENPIILKACANQVTREDHVSKEYELYLMNLMTKAMITSKYTQ